jgi:hypothetical protein
MTHQGEKQAKEMKVLTPAESWVSTIDPANPFAIFLALRLDVGYFRFLV